MINTEITTTKGMEQAQRQMEQAKNRMALEKKKANQERRRRENAHKYMMGGVVHKYFPECYCFEESEMNEILKAALATPQCQKVIADIKARASIQKEELDSVEWFDLEEVYQACQPPRDEKFCVPMGGLEIVRKYVKADERRSEGMASGMSIGF